MRGIFLNSAYFGLVISIIGYAIGVILNKKLKIYFLNPLLISIIFIIVFLLIFNIDFENYNQGGKYLSYFLTPATVCFAIPLYQQLELLKKNMKAIIFGLSAGVLLSLGSILGLSYLFNLTHTHYVTLIPKSITTAIGIGLSEELGGIKTITVAAIIITGVFGNISAVGICKIFKIKEPIAVGLAIGSSSHAMRTSKAIEIGEIEGAMSSLSVAVSGLLTVITSIFASFL